MRTWINGIREGVKKNGEKNWKFPIWEGGGGTFPTLPTLLSKKKRKEETTKFSDFSGVAGGIPKILKIPIFFNPFRK